jgi:hypothetical protein
MIINKKLKEADVLCNVIGDMTFREAADYLNDGIPELYKRTHQSVFNWFTGGNKMPGAVADALTRYYPEDDDRHQLGKVILQMREKAAEAQ